MSLECTNMNNVVLYPSEILDAMENAKTDKDKNGYGAFRIGFDRPRKCELVTYYPFEVKVKSSNGQYVWTPVSLKFVNLTHVGRISPLIGGDVSRTSRKIYAINLLFKGNYEYTRTATNQTRIVEKYGLVKQMISKAFEAHAAHAKRNGFISKNTKVIGNVKTTQEVTEHGKLVSKVLESSNININISIRFAGKVTDEQGVKNETKPDTKFQCKILDANRQKDKVGRDEFPFHDAMLRNNIDNEYNIPICNGNIHEFIRGGSTITGVENMKSCSLSGFGFSLPASCDVIFVKQASPVRVAPSIFANDFADIAGAETPIMIEDSKENSTNDSTGFEDEPNDGDDVNDGDMEFN